MHCSFDFVFVINVFTFHVATLKPTCPYRQLTARDSNRYKSEGTGAYSYGKSELF